MEQVDRIVWLVREVLGPDVVGAYLHGSAVLGQLRPHSDTDVLVVSRRRTTVVEKRTLIDRLLPISGRGDPSGVARPIELTIVVHSEVRPWRYPPRIDFMYGDWLRDAFESGDLAPWPTPNPDLAVLLAMVLLGDRPLIGPPPADILDPIPQDDLRRAAVAGIPGLVDDLEADTANVILTLARIWTTVTTGTIRSKDAAADWVLPRLPPEHRAVLARARAVYLGDEDDQWDDLRPRIRPLVDRIVDEVELVFSDRRVP